MLTKIDRGFPRVLRPKALLALVLATQVASADSATSPAAGARPTFSRDILPILQSKCQDCHRPGQIAPISFLDYQQTRPWAKAIRQAVVDRKMPPFSANAPLGHFVNDGRLTDDQIQLIVRWIDTGAPEGSPSDAPAPILWNPDGWAMGKPDMILEFPAYTSKPNKTDEEILLYSDRVFDRNTWVQTFELRTNDYRLVHHAGVFIGDDKVFVPDDLIIDSADEHLDKFGGASNGGLVIFAQPHLYTWLPGQRVETRSKGEGFRIPKGGRLILQTHLAPTDEARPLKITLGLKFVNGDLRNHSKEFTSWMTDLRVPPSVASHVERQTLNVGSDVSVTGFYMHMHLRGKSAQILFHYPDGRTETVLDVPHYDFNWQREYLLAKPLPVPKGTNIEFVGEWDNSTGNPFNPDPTQEIRWGGKTTDEMYSANVYYSVPRLHPLHIEEGHVIGPAQQE